MCHLFVERVKCYDIDQSIRINERIDDIVGNVHND